MWTSLNCNNYILKKEITEDGFIIYVSDFIRIWSAELKNEEIVSLCKEMNPLIEASAEKYVEKISLLIDTVSTVSKRVEESKDQLTLHLDSSVGNVKFKFKIDFFLQTAELLYKKLTLPLMMILTRLTLREKTLIDIINKKEAEINEYKRENVTIERSHLITKSFNLKELREEEDQDPSFKNVENNPSLIFQIIDQSSYPTSTNKHIEKHDTTMKKTDKTSKIENITENECDTKCRKKKLRSQTVTKKNKIDFQNNFLFKKKSGSKQVNLKM